MSIEVLENVTIDETLKNNIEEPERWKVILLNDDHTPMDFVISILQSIFKHSAETAEKIMLEIHEKGSGIAGTYSFEIAEQKSVESTVQARKKGFPLCVLLEQVL